jgi:Fur family zinc uptake transcriptional regulator
MDMLADWQARRVAPPTVYRALAFLQDQHFIHKIHSLNAFIGCPDPDNHHQGHFLICKQCGVAVECGAPNLDQALMEAAETAGFQVQQQTVEILGCCPACRDKGEETQL